MAIALSGSLILSGSIIVSGSITSTGTVIMSGSIASASYALNATTGAYANTSTSASYALNATTFNGLASSIFATTGSNTFIGNQVVSGSLTTSGSITSTSTITAQTLVVQTITSSIVYSSGSNIFGNAIGNTQTFTGSVNITGSINLSGSAQSTNYISQASSIISGLGSYDWSIMGRGTNNGSAILINDIAGANYAISTGGYNLTFSKHVSGSNTFVPAMTIYGGSATNSTPNIGIGTTSPTYLLDVNGTGRFSSSVTIGTNLASGTALAISNTTNARQFQFGYSTGAGYNYFQVYDGTSFQALVLNNALTLASTGAATFSSSVQINQTASEIQQIINSNAVTNPSITQYRVNNSSGWEIGMSNQANLYSYIFSYGTFGTSNAKFTLTSAGAATFSSSVTANGITNGDGTADTRIVTRPNTPYALGLQNSTTSNIYYLGVTSSAATANFQIYNTYSAASIFSMTYQGAATFSNYITSKGLVVVGASGGYTTGDNTWINLGGSSGADNFGAINMPFADKMRLNSYWGFSFRTSNNGASGTPVEVASISTSGAATFSSSVTVSGTLTESSSIRYKTNVETIKYGLDKVLQMRGVTYTKKDTGLQELGLIAEEINEILPEVVLKNEEGEPDSVSYGRITAVLIEAIKEQQKQIEELKALIK